MATWYAQAGGDWDAVSGGTTSSVWFTLASGGSAMDIAGKVSGTTWTDTANTYVLNGQAVNLKIASSVSCTILVAAIQAGAAAGTIVVGSSGAVVLGQVGNLCAVSSSYAGTMLTWAAASGSITVNGTVAYSSTSTAGMWTVGTGQTITVQNSGGAGTYAVSGSGAGTTIVTSGTGILTVTNSGGSSLRQTSSGCVVNSAGTGAVALTGDVSHTGGGSNAALILGSTSTSHTLSGNVLAGSGGGALNITGGTLTWTTGSGTNIGAVTGSGQNWNVTVGASGTLTIVGSLVMALPSTHANVAFLTSGTVNWTGAATLASNENCLIAMLAGTVNLATASAALALANSGNFVILKYGGTLNVTNGGYVATVTKQAATATQSVVGYGSAVPSTFLVGPSVPSAADTRYGVTRGYADGGTGATTGCGVAGGNGLLEIPNSGTPTGTQDATSDACVVSGKKYGSPQRTGSRVVGGVATDEVTLAKETGANARGGSGTCAKLTPTNNSVYGYWYFYVPTTASTQFTLSFWHKIASGFSGLVKCSIYDTDQSTLLLTSESVTLTDDGAYHQYSATPVTPTATGMSLVRIEVKKDAGDTTEAVYIDDISYA